MRTFSARPLVPYTPSPSPSPPPTPPPSPSIVSLKLEDYVRQLDDDQSYNEKFKFSKSRSSFSIEHLPADPEQLLKEIFQKCFDQAVEKSRAAGINPDRMGATIKSIHMDPEIHIGMREINPNSVISILHRFEDVAQSKTGEQSLYGAPFIVEFTLQSKKDLEESVKGEEPTAKRQKIIGSGPGHKRKLTTVHHNVNASCLLKVKNPDDGHCLFYALQATLMYQLMESKEFYEYLKGRKNIWNGRLEGDAMQTMRLLGIPRQQKQYDAAVYVPRIVDHWNRKYEGRYQIKVFIFGELGHYKPKYSYGPERYNKAVVLYHNNKHFDGVRTVASLFKRNNYCLSCQTTFDNVQRHNKSCKIFCLNCARHGPGYPCPDENNYRRKCDDCQKVFTNADCYRHHKQNRFCQNSKKCNECGVIWDVKVNTVDGRNGHICGEKYCHHCKRFHGRREHCHIKPLNAKQQRPYRKVFFDIETTQDTQVDPVLFPGRKKHIPNFLAAKIVCNRCIEEGKWNQSLTEPGASCEVCGPYRTVTFSPFDFHDTKVDKKFFTNTPVKEFINMLLFKLPKQYDTVIFAHNSGRFDSMFCLPEIFEQGLNPANIINRGNKVFEIRVLPSEKSGELIFRDSLNLLPFPLASMPAAFGLDVEDKPWFPHLANKEANYGLIFDSLPPKSDYLYGGFKPEKKAEFDEWWEEHKNEHFNLLERLPEYCCNDVQILTAACVAFQKEFFETSRREGKHEGIDVLREACTIASATMKHFKLNHLKERTVGIVPENGYDTEERQSLKALKFMDWKATKEDAKIQTARSKGGEKVVHADGRQYKLDGWIEEQQKGIEFHGCLYHACPKCYPDDQMVLPIFNRQKITAGKRREEDRKRTEALRRELPNLEIYWEHEVDEMLQHDPDMAKHFADYEDDGPIHLRDGFMGGRTGPCKVYHKAPPGHKIGYFDVTSEYPFICATTAYPVDHPSLEVVNQLVDWKHPDDNPYKLSVLKVFVVPPKHVDVPVLPVKFDERLLFPLCKTCALEHPEGAALDNYICPHKEDKERGWIGEYNAIELDAALAAGYRVKKVYRVLQWHVSDNTLFRDYIAEFMAMKVHASGFPVEVKGNEELEEKYMDECRTKFGIHIERAKMIPNKAKRTLTKLCLNSLWGRFSIRSGLSHVEIVDDPARLCEMLNDRSIDVTDLYQLSEEVILVTYETKKPFIEENESSNVLISSWTTSAARLYLLKLMEKVVRAPGCVLLYVDTDSLVYSYPEGANPLESDIGPHLGQLTDEIGGDYEIVEWVCGGPKNYAIKLHKKGAPPDQFEYIVKVRGFRLSWDVQENQGLRYERMKEMVLHYAETGEREVFPIHYPNFLRPSMRKGIVYSTPLTKNYRAYISKGVLTPDYFVRDFGYTPKDE